MAVSKVVNETSLSIEVQKGTDKAGDPNLYQENFLKFEKRCC